MPAAAQLSGATIVDPPNTTPMTAVNNIVDIMEDGEISQNSFSNLSIAINNSLRSLDAVGSLEHIDIKAGRLQVTGSMSIYYENSDAYTRFINGEEFSFSFRVQDEDGRRRADHRRLAARRLGRAARCARGGEHPVLHA